MITAVTMVEKDLKEKGPRYHTAKTMHKLMSGKITLEDIPAEEIEYLNDLISYFVQSGSERTIKEFIERIITNNGSRQ
jgi:hypothetical protein